MKRISLFCLCLFLCSGLKSQKFEYEGSQQTIYTNSLWSNWFVQADLDMTLQNPYGYDFRDVFPNGKSFGLDLSLGKWFTPELALRGRFNWENALPLLENGHANWLAPFYHPGVNRNRGGYIAFYGDVLLNLHNLFCQYQPNRTWNLSVYPRVGINYNFGVSKGALLMGIGILNTYRITPFWSLYLDMSYMMTGSGFVGSENVKSTGIGSNSNGYFSLGLGAQLELGQPQQDAHSVSLNSFWKDWFVQAGADMSLMNPYGCNFSQVFPKGNTFGLNVALGKWFTPEIALRGRLNWENGLIENKRLEWVPPVKSPRDNFADHGFSVMSLEAMLNVTNLIGGYREMKKWQTATFVRAGLCSHFSQGSESPLLGVGVEQTYRLNVRYSLFGSMAYQVTTSEGSAGLTGMKVATGSNGFFDIDLGIIFDLGKHTWKHKDTQ